MEIKVCGIRTRQNLSYLNQADVEMIGLIFFERSKRFVEQGDVNFNDLKSVSKKKVGVFVNASEAYVKAKIAEYGLHAIQLHGEESPAYCKVFKGTVEVIKAFSVSDKLPNNIGVYLGAIDRVLFDTKGVDYGGNGIKFDWQILESYDFGIPFMVSGGIGPNDVEAIKNIKNPEMVGVDVNSKFELEPGLKNEAVLEKFIKEIKN